MRKIEWNPNPDTNAHAVAYLHDMLSEMPDHRTMRPCVVVLPGGAYSFCSQREGDPAALEFFGAGLNVVLVDQYSTGAAAADYHPLCDAGHVILDIRRNAAAWGCDPEAVIVLGFSAGGHLAACLGTLWKDPVLRKKLCIRGREVRPDGMILCYPVIRADQLTHEETLRQVSGCEPGTAGYQFWAVQDHVDAETCPAFLWHTAADQTVPVENTFAMAEALQAHGVPFECHIFPGGEHGMSVCTRETSPDWPEAEYNSHWVRMSLRWIGRQFRFQK